MAVPQASTSGSTELKGWSTREIPSYHKRKLLAIAWNCTGQRLATGGGDQYIRTWRIEPHSSVTRHEKVESEWQKHGDLVTLLKWHPTSPDTLASSTFLDKSVRLWDARTGKGAHSVIQCGTGNRGLAWNPDGYYLAVGNRDGCITVMDARKLRAGRTHRVAHETYQLLWPSRDQLFVSTDAGTVEVLGLQPGSSWDWASVWSLKSHAAECYTLDISRDSRYLISGGADALVSLWDLDQVCCIRTFPHLDEGVRSVSLSHDSRFASWGTEGSGVEVASVQGGEVLQSFSQPRERVCDGVAWNPVHPVLAYGREGQRDDRQDIGYAGLCIFAPPRASG